MSVPSAVHTRPSTSSKFQQVVGNRFIHRPLRCVLFSFSKFVVCDPFVSISLVWFVLFSSFGQPTEQPPFVIIVNFHGQSCWCCLRRHHPILCVIIGSACIKIRHCPLCSPLFVTDFPFLLHKINKTAE